MAQEWRYFSREKSIIHTLHLSQLPGSRVGDPVFIVPIPPTGTTQGGNGFNLPPLSVPSFTPYRGLDWTKVTHNIPPLWAVSNATVAINQQSGSYGFTGTFGPFDTNVTNNSFEWAATGGAFLVIGRQGACANGFDLMSSERVILFNSPQDTTFQGEFHEGQYFIHIQGADWYNQFYVSEKVGGAEPIEAAAILGNVPNPSQSLAVRNLTSNIEPDAGCGFQTTEIIVLRLGP